MFFGEEFDAATATPADKSKNRKPVKEEPEEDSCCGIPRRFVTPVIAGLMFLAIGITILAGAGRSTSTSSKAKAIVFLVDGLKATTFEELAVQGTKAPNIQNMINNGKHAVCYGRSDTRCCRTQSGTRLGSQYSFQSAPGMASILTGVDANKHQVYNTSFDAMLRFTTTAPNYPTFLKTAISAGYKTGAVGTNTLLTTVGDGSLCNAYGVADFECGAAAISRCMRSSSCNLVERDPLVTSDQVPDVTLLQDMFADVQSMVAQGTDIIVVHTTRVNKAALTAKGGNYSSNSYPYAAQLYLADSLIGMIAALISRRAQTFQENWLLLGTSDHGGHNSTFGSVIDNDDIGPLWAQVITANGPATIVDAVQPVRQMDVAPTILEWFNLLTTDTSANLDGRVQFICGIGTAGGNCSGALA